MPPKIVFLDRETLGVPLRAPHFPHTYVEYPATSPDQVLDRLSGAQIAITNKVPLRANMMAHLPDLKLIAVAATGTDIIDKPFAKTEGIAVCNIRGYATNTVPEHVLALIFALKRSLIPYVRDMQNGKWPQVRQFCYFDHPITDIAGSTLGIIGRGELGQSLARRAEALGMKVIFHSRTPGEGVVDLNTLLATSDVISLHCPLTDQTRNVIGREQLQRMKQSAFLINTGRGGLVDEQALADALRAGIIAGAGVDVLTTEPPTTGNVLLDPTIPNLIITPHVAWASVEAMTGLAEQLVGNIEAWVAGNPRNLVEA